MSFGNKIKELRVKNSLNQESFANRIGVSRRTVIDWEKDRFDPNMGNLKAICDEFDIDISYFIGQEVNTMEEKSIEPIESEVIIDPNSDILKNIYIDENSNYKYYRKKFISENESRLASDFPKCLQENLCAKIAPENSDTNLYLLTVPLVDGKGKCAIEDLFDSDVRGHVIDGKQFTMNNNFNEQLHYGKEIFSKYVLNNYQSINFDNFRPMLDKISEIIDANSKGNDVQLDQCAACDLSETKAESSI